MLVCSVSRKRPKRAMRKWSSLLGRTRPGCDRPATSTWADADWDWSAAMSEVAAGMSTVSFEFESCISLLALLDRVAVAGSRAANPVLWRATNLPLRSTLTEHSRLRAACIIIFCLDTTECFPRLTVGKSVEPLQPDG